MKRSSTSAAGWPAAPSAALIDRADAGREPQPFVLAPDAMANFSPVPAALRDEEMLNHQGNTAPRRALTCTLRSLLDGRTGQ